jgi:hypothetical protein
VKPLSAKIAAIGFCLLFFVSTAFPKAAISKLVISNGKLARSAEVTDSRLMQSSNPWFGKFIPAWNQAPRQSIAKPPAGTPRYKISFYASFLPGKPPHVVYVACYTFDPSTRQGFIYLPGTHDWEYSTNAGSVMRPNQDGRWNLADPGWCKQINEIISRSVVRQLGNRCPICSARTMPAAIGFSPQSPYEFPAPAPRLPE